MKDDCFDCEQHHDKFAPRQHPDGKHNNSKHLADHERGVGAPGHHTSGSMPSQLNPDHGPHHHKGR